MFIGNMTQSLDNKVIMEGVRIQKLYIIQILIYKFVFKLYACSGFTWTHRKEKRTSSIAVVAI